MLLWQLIGPSIGHDGAPLSGMYGTTSTLWEENPRSNVVKGLEISSESGNCPRRFEAYVSIPRRDTDVGILTR